MALMDLAVTSINIFVGDVVVTSTSVSLTKTMEGAMNKIYFIMVIVMIFTWSGQVDSQSKQKTRAFSEETILYKPVSDHLVIGEPVMVDFTVNNNLAEPMKLDLGANFRGAFRVAVTRPDGTAIICPPIQREGFSVGGSIMLPPGGSYKQLLVLNEWCDFQVPGRYTVDLKLSTPIKTKQGAILASEANLHAIFEISPKDISKLSSTCASIWNRFVSTQTYQQASEVAVALSYVNDPVAIPYLEKLLHANRMLESVALSGLARIGDNQAVQVLLSALIMKNKETAIMASQQLYNIKNGIKDPELKKKVEQALLSFANSDKRR